MLEIFYQKIINLLKLLLSCITIDQTTFVDLKTLQYKKLVLQALSFNKSLSAFDVSIKIEKSLPLTNKILTDLVKHGLLREDGYASSTGGRRPLNYSIAPEKVYVVSIAIDQHITKISIIDIADGIIRHQQRFEFSLVDKNHSLEKLGDLIVEYLEKGYVEKDKILGIGIGMPGFVDVKKGLNYSYFKEVLLKKENIPTLLENKVGVPVYIDNDSSVITLTEQMMGKAQGKSDALVINFGWGIGLGMILNGQLFRGYNGFAGEFSHIPLFNNNKICSCGKTGCIETEASMLTIVQDIREALKKGRASVLKGLPDDLEAASEKVIQAAIAGDLLAVEVFTLASYNIGKGIAILIHILNPELIIISGRGADVGALTLAPIGQAINKYCIPRLASYTQIAVSSLSKNSETLGAAALVIENFDESRITHFEKKSIPI
ncbi:MAG: ROK family protein [Chitinophagaceae bacterium]|nr:ROK family protein [Chitinophagaceae bacterium]